MSSSLDIQKIVQKRLSKGQFFEEQSDKTQIYLHHTAGNGNAEGVARFWNSNDSQIATAFVVGENGTIVQCFSSKHWAWHLGIDSQDFTTRGLPYKNLNKLSVGIEVCNWGMLKEKNGKFFNYVGGEINPSYVTTLRQLVVYLCETYGIPKAYRKEIWSLDNEAFKGSKGIYTHNSVRKDKADIYPCPRMIKMLQSL